MSEKYYMSSIQKRLYVVSSMKVDDVSYNTPKIFGIDGQINIDKLQKAFEKLGMRYELLRTTFENDGENFYQVVHEEIICRVEEYKSDQNVANIVSDFVRPFDLKSTMERPRRGTGKMLTLKIQYSKCAGGKNDDRNIRR